MYRPTLNFLASLAAFAFTGALLYGCNAFAADATVSWVNATQDIAGNVLPASGDAALRDTRVRYGTCNAAKTAVATVAKTVVVPIAQTSTVIAGLADGEYCFQGRHSTAGDVYSDWSAAASKTISTAPVFKKPQPPSGLAVQ